MTRTQHHHPPGFLRRCWLRFRAQREGRPYVEWTLTHDDSGMVVSWRQVDFLNAGQWACSWSDIELVEAFKRDCLTVDSIRVVLTTRGGDTFELQEEMPGFDGLMRAMSSHLPGFRDHDEWWSEVAFPAFEQNLTLLYRRSREGDARQAT